MSQLPDQEPRVLLSGFAYVESPRWHEGRLWFADGSLSNRRVWAGGVGPEGICVDAEGAVWAQSASTRTHTGRSGDPEGEIIRVREGGQILERYVLDRAGFARMLGGPGRRTLFILANEWRGIDN